MVRFCGEVMVRCNLIRCSDVAFKSKAFVRGMELPLVQSSLGSLQIVRMAQDVFHRVKKSLGKTNG